MFIPGYEAEEVAGSHQSELELLPQAPGEPDGRSALDLTCGPGAQALALAALGWQVTGLDLTPA